MNERIPVYGPLLEEDDFRAAEGAMRRKWLGMGRDVEAFEAAVLAAIGATDHKAIALSTGFAALHTALIVAGVGPGDEVIVPSLCHLSNVQSVLATGAEPVFCDVTDDTLCIDVERAAELIGPRTRAVIALDYGCNLADHDAVNALAAAHGLRVVDDAAHAFGSSSAGRPVGSFSDLCMFSFDPVKSLTAIDAGVLVVRREDEERTAREVRFLGSDQPAAVMYKNARTWDYDAVRDGFRYHVSNVHAALGANQIGKLERIRATRQAACVRYAENLKGIDPVDSPQGDVDELCPFMYFIRVPADDRDALRAHLSDAGIDTGMHWRPAHLHTHFAGFRQGPLPVSTAAGEQLVTLPLHSDMALATVDRVTDAVVDFFAGR